mmetsp:Transcript_9850/g.14159  ORF Transcript_9850/g.14159 Transcript_9850/m.14159 type:complete len:91 (-) Transcript_9850:455-727(-)
MTVALTSSYLLGMTKYGTPDTPGKILVIASHIFVGLNYVLGAIIGYKVLDRPGFALYCAVFAFLWFWVAFFGSGLMSAPQFKGDEMVGLQ